MSSSARVACSSRTTARQSGSDRAMGPLSARGGIAAERAGMRSPTGAGGLRSLCAWTCNYLASIASMAPFLAIFLRTTRRKRMASRPLDRLDRRILEELQANARISNQELAKRVGLSAAPCWRRLRRLEQAGVIAGYATLLRAPSIGLPILAYAVISLENHHPESV